MWIAGRGTRRLPKGRAQSEGGGREPPAATQLALYQAEFVIMRTEIGRLIDQQRDLLNFSLTAFGALIALIGLVTPDKNGSSEAAAASPVVNVLLLVPMLYLVLALWAADVSRRVWVITNYLTHVTGKARQLADDPDLWAWEEWKVQTHERMSRREKASVWALERARWLSLVLPPVTAVAAWFMLSHSLDATTGFLLALDLTALASTVALLTRTGDSAGAPAIRARPSRLGRRRRGIRAASWSG